jgi:general L-amino acid transport system permease protein
VVAVIWLLALAAVPVVLKLASRRRELTGRPVRTGPVVAGLLLLIPLSYFVLGQPLGLDFPVMGRFRPTGGFVVQPEFVALVVGLAIYTGAFIAEIVRGSIQAVPKGQKEAAEALGLTPRQQLRLVVLPQALRVAIPPLNSQYLNLLKNSSLALAIGYPEIVSVSNTIINQAARATQMLLLVMGTYLVMSLTISALMNALNRAVTRKGRA